MLLATIPFSIPLHPACTIPITLLSGSARYNGIQSATWIDKTTDFEVLIIASVNGIFPGTSTTFTSDEWTCWGLTILFGSKLISEESNFLALPTQYVWLKLLI